MRGISSRAFFTIALSLLPLVSLPLSLPLAEARQGCCSHHGGVCGCGCCDGSPLSATCAPYYPECNRAPTGTTRAKPPPAKPPPAEPASTQPAAQQPVTEQAPAETQAAGNPEGAPVAAAVATPSTSSEKNPIGTLIGAAIVGGGGYWYMRRRRLRKKRSSS